MQINFQKNNPNSNKTKVKLNHSVTTIIPVDYD